MIAVLVPLVRFGERRVVHAFRYAERTFLTSGAGAFSRLRAGLEPGQDPSTVMVGMSAPGVALLIRNIKEGLYNPVTMPTVITGDPKTSDSNWLHRIHERHFDLPWGQPFDAMPDVLKPYLLELDPAFKGGAKLTFGHMRDLRSLLMETAEEAGIRVIKESVVSISKEGTVQTNQGRQIEVKYPALYVNLAQVEYTPGVQDSQGSPIKVVGHTIMYEKSPEELKEMFSDRKRVPVIGNGYSFTWLATHFGREFPMVCLHQPGSKLPIPTGISTTFYENVSFLSMDEITIEAAEEDLLIVRGKVNGKMQELLIPNMMLAAAGYRHKHELTEHLPQHQVLTLSRPDAGKSDPHSDPVCSALSLRGSILNQHMRMVEESGSAPLLNIQYTPKMLEDLKLKLAEEKISVPDNYWSVLANIVKEKTDLSSSVDAIRDLHLTAFDEACKGKPLGIEGRKSFEEFLTRHLEKDAVKHGLKPRV